MALLAASNISSWRCRPIKPCIYAPAFAGRSGAYSRHLWRRKGTEGPSSSPSPPDKPEVTNELEKVFDVSTPEGKKAVERLSAAGQRIVEIEMRRDKLEKEEKFEAKRFEEEAQEKADQLVADAEVTASEKLMKAAELRLQEANREQQAMIGGPNERGERIESIKAFGIAAGGGLAALIPLIWASSSGASAISGWLSLLSGIATCGLFGITYRYAVSADPQNVQLKSGVVSAFTVVRGLGEADAVQSLNRQEAFNLLDTDILGFELIAFAQCVILFGFAAAALETGLRSGILKTFGEAPKE